MSGDKANALPVVDVFNPPYKIWSQRELNEDELLAHYQEHKHFKLEVNDKLVKSVGSAISAATHMAEVIVDSALENFIDDVLRTSPVMSAVRRAMPLRTPKNLSRYQTHYPAYDATAVDAEIQEYGAILGCGQSLFHGGGWPDGVEEFTTKAPLSTSFCPQIAMRNAEHKGKAYDLGRMDLIVLKVKSMRGKAYVYGVEGDLKHEKEVVFGAGATLKLISRTYIRDVKASKVVRGISFVHAMIPCYVIEAEIS